jgi:hypothetical protein
MAVFPRHLRLMLVAAGVDRRATVKTMWEVVKAILRDSDKVAPPSERTHSLLRGARRFLESSFASVIRNTIQSNRAQVMLPSVLTNLSVRKLCKPCLR